MIPEEIAFNAQAPLPPTSSTFNKKLNSSPSLPQEDYAISDMEDNSVAFEGNSNGVIEDIVKPSIKAFMKTCVAHPRIVVLVAAFVFLAALLVVAILCVYIGHDFILFARFLTPGAHIRDSVLSVLALVLSPIFTFPAGVTLAVVGGLLSFLIVTFKLVVTMLLATVPLVEKAFGLLATANSVLQFFLQITKIANFSSGLVGHLATHGTLLNPFKFVNWKTLSDPATAIRAYYSSYNVKEVGPMLLTAWDMSVTVSTTVYSAVNAAWSTFQAARSNSGGGDPNFSNGAGADDQGSTEFDILQGAPALSRRSPFRSAES